MVDEVNRAQKLIGRLLLIDPRDMPNTGDEAMATKAVEIYGEATCSIM